MKAANRCLTCNKRVGLTGFKCKCGSTFCGSHRYPENHDCDYNFKKAGRNAIAKVNPEQKSFDDQGSFSLEENFFTFSVFLSLVIGSGSFVWGGGLFLIAR
ncbi:Zinc finger A20 and AN1 domain-containing stress-associated protein 7 [Linum perenne]